MIELKADLKLQMANLYFYKLNYNFLYFIFYRVLFLQSIN